MQDTLKPVPTPDNLFHDGNPASGELGTIVGADWLNNAQSAIQSAQQELLTVLKDSGQAADPKRQDQLLQAIRKIAWGGNAKPATLAGYGIADGLTLRPQLGDKADLNAIVDDGLYHNRLNASAANGANYPQPRAGLLFVYSDDSMVYQQYQCYDDAGCWYRCRYNGNWQPWRKLADAATTLAGYGITDAQPLNNNLSALANLNTTGLVVDTGPGTAVTRAIVAGQGITVSNGDGKAGNPAIALANSGAAAGTYGMVTVDAMGRVTAGRQMQPTDVPGLDWSKITTGKPTTLAGYGVTDAQNRFVKDFRINGSSDLFYPIWWTTPAGSSDGPTLISLCRHYAWNGNPEERPLNKASEHQASLLLEIEQSENAWGGGPNFSEIKRFYEGYNNTLSHFSFIMYSKQYRIDSNKPNYQSVNDGTFGPLCIPIAGAYLRGGGLSYRIISSQPLDYFGFNDGKASSQTIFEAPHVNAKWTVEPIPFSSRLSPKISTTAFFHPV